MAEKVNRFFLIFFWVLLLLPLSISLAQESAFTETGSSVPSAPVPSIDNGSGISLIIARPVDVSKNKDQDNSWLAAYSHEFLLFRLGAVSPFHIADPESLASQFSSYTLYNDAPPSKQSYLSYARKAGISWLLFPEYKAERKSGTIQFSIVLQPIEGEKNRILSSASCDADKADEGLDSCIAQLMAGSGIKLESYTTKFLKTKIAGSGKCEKLLGTTVSSSFRAKDHQKLADNLKKCSDQEPQSLLSYFVAAREYAKSAAYENAAQLMKDLIFKLGPTYPSLYPLDAQYFRLAEKYENALQIIKVGEGLNLKTNKLIVEKAQILEALNDPSNAETAYQEVMVFEPNNFHALLFLIKKYNKDQKPVEAIKLSETFERLYPENGREYLEKGKSLLALSRTREAQDALSKAGMLLLNDPEPRMLLGDLAMQNKEYSSALKSYAKALDLTPQNVDIHLKIARAYTLNSNPQAALETLKKIEGKFYDNPVVKMALRNIILAIRPRPSVT
jgi:tetratricopeptide (TPR) repeat protein